MLILIKKRKWGSPCLPGALFCLLALLVSVLIWKSRAAPVLSAVGLHSPSVVVLDPGHGGEDGGAVSKDGTVESAINLAVALQLREVFLFLGQETVITRQSDISLHSPEAGTIRERKVSDLKNRVALVNEKAGNILISIHQNMLPSVSSVHGAQVFYNTVEGAQELALSMQDALNAVINTEKGKVCKKIPASIYLMSHVERMGVLVECGFLSNPSETALLQTLAHQNKLAISIAAGFFNRPSDTNEETSP